MHDASLWNCRVDVGVDMAMIITALNVFQGHEERSLMLFVRDVL